MFSGESVRVRPRQRIPQGWNRCTPPVNSLAEPFSAQPLRFDVDPAPLAARIAEIAADETWPDSLRTAARDAGTGLEVSDLTDDTIATALTARLRAGQRRP
jgi:hypothetical protein